MEKQTRMRWKLDNNKYTTVQSFLGTGGKLLKVMIDIPTSTIHIMEVHDGFMNAIDTKIMATVAKCKSEAKKMLQGSGVIFFEETRKKQEHTEDMKVPE